MSGSVTSAVVQSVIQAATVALQAEVASAASKVAAAQKVLQSLVANATTDVAAANAALGNAGFITKAEADVKVVVADVEKAVPAMKSVVSSFTWKDWALFGGGMVAVTSVAGVVAHFAFHVF